jgi:DNA-binding transcriptional LysR family regulator
MNAIDRNRESRRVPTAPAERPGWGKTSSVHALLPALYDALIVAQTSSVGEAARRLHKTPSAVSQQLRRIEQHYGLNLFERVGRRLRPSPAGEAALGALTRVFDEAATLETLLGELAGARVTTLRIAASDYLGEALLLPVMRWLFTEEVPLRFEITTTNSVEAGRLVGEGQVDVGIASAAREPGPDDVVLLRQPFHWIAPRRRGAGPPTSRLSREPVLRLAPGSQGRRLLDEYLGRSGLRPLSTVDLPSVSLMLSYVSQGLGIGLVPALALERADRKRITVEPAAVPEVTVRLALHPALKRSAPVRRFLDRLVLEAQRADRRLAR